MLCIKLYDIDLVFGGSGRVPFGGPLDNCDPRALFSSVMRIKPTT